MPATGWLKTIGRPIDWRLYGLGLAAMLSFAGIDMLGAVLANEWALRHHPVWVVAGLATFALLFAVYAARRLVAELAVVALGWIVFLQDGLLAIDHGRYGVSFPPGTALAIVAILILQAYLVLAHNGSAN